MTGYTLVTKAGADRTNRDQWLNHRRTGLGGSDAATLLDLNPWDTRYGLWLDKTGRIPHSDAGVKAEWGHRLEGVIREAFTDQQGVKVRRHGMIRSTIHRHMLFSPDGFTSDGGIYEGKTSGWRMRDQWDDGAIPDLAACQVQWGMAITGRAHAWVVGLLDGWDLRIRKVTRDPDLIGLLIREAETFWNLVETDEAPPITGADLGALTRLHADCDDTVAVAQDAADIAREYLARRAALRSAQAALDETKARMVDAIGPSSALVDHTGVEYATRRTQTQTRWDTERLGTDHPEYAVRSTIRVLRVHTKPKRPKENQNCA